MFPEYRDRISERLGLANLAVAFGEIAIPCARLRPPLSDYEAREPCAWGMNDEICEQPRPCPDLKKQIDEKLGTADRQIDNRSRRNTFILARPMTRPRFLSSPRIWFSRSRLS
jgi:hypothetical protein